MRKSYLKKVATKSFVGRVLRRLLGEEKGTVMMEYIVVGLLVVAAAVVAVAVFGDALVDMFNVLGHVVVNKKDTAVTKLVEIQGNTTTRSNKAVTHADSKINQDNTDATGTGW